MPFFIVLCLGLSAGAPARADRASELIDFFTKDDIKFAAPDWAAELRRLNPTEARALLKEVQKNRRVLARAEAGNEFFAALWNMIGDQFAGRGAVERFSQETLHFIERAANRRGKPNLIAAEMNAARSLGVERVDFFMKAENRDLRKLWEKRVQEELMRAESLRDDRLPAAELQLWRASMVARYKKFTFQLRVRLVRRFADEFLLRSASGRTMTAADFGGGGLHMSAALNANPRRNPRDPPDLAVVNAAEETFGVYWKDTGKPFRIFDRRPAFLGRVSVSNATATGEYEMLVGLIRELDAILAWCERVPERVDPDEMRVSLAALDSEAQADRESLLDWAQAYAEIEELSSHTPDLLALILELAWARADEDANYWEKHAELSAHLPKFRFASVPPPWALTSHLDPVTPPPIQDYQTSPFYEIDADPAAELPGVFRHQRPPDFPADEWDRFTPAAAGPGLTIRSVADLTVAGEWLAVPTPIHHVVAAVTLDRADEGHRSGVDFELWRSRKSRAFAVRARSGTLENVRLAVSFVPDPAVVKTPAPPAVAARTWRALAIDLRQAGEYALSDAFYDADALDAEGARRLVERHTRYSYHPEGDAAEGPGPFGTLTPFLDDSGQLCIQCVHASTFLLTPLLRRAYAGNPDFTFQSNHFLLRQGRTLILPGHDATEVFWRGRLHAHLDPSPAQKDERAPRPFARRRDEDAAATVTKRDLLRELVLEVHERAMVIWPTRLPDDSPYGRVRRLAERTLRHEPVTEDDVEAQVTLLKRWIDARVGGQRMFKEVSRFHRTMEEDLRRILALVHDVIQLEDCARELGE